MIYMGGWMLLLIAAPWLIMEMIWGANRKTSGTLLLLFCLESAALWLIQYAHVSGLRSIPLFLLAASCTLVIFLVCAKQRADKEKKDEKTPESENILFSLIWRMMPYFAIGAILLQLLRMRRG